MIDTYDVKDSMRKTDIIWDSFNKLLIGKQTGGIGATEFSELLINIGDVFANQVKRGKVNNDDIISYKSYISQFLGKNVDKYFAFPHEGLKTATETTYESISFAKEDLYQRNLEARPVMSSDNYEKGYKKLGS